MRSRATRRARLGQAREGQRWRDRSERRAVAKEIGLMVEQRIDQLVEEHGVAPAASATAS